MGCTLLPPAFRNGRMTRGSGRCNLDKLKRGYAAWNDNLGDSLDVWREIMAEDFRLASIDVAAGRPAGLFPAAFPI